MDYSEFLQGELANSDGLREIGSHYRNSSTLINLGGGLPNPEVFPLIAVSLTVKNRDKVTLGEEDLKHYQQYLPPEGAPRLLNWIRELQQKIHSPPYAKEHPEKYREIVTYGSAEGNCGILDVVTNYGDMLLTEDPSFSAALTLASNRKLRVLGVKTDEHGIIPSSLRKVLRNSSERVRLLYTVPTGGNPKGSLLTLDRKKEIYKLAQEYNFLILEDDPYYFLQYEGDRIPSFLSLDTDGLVLRCDSFSKVLAPGFRSGFLSGPEPIVTRVRDRLSMTRAGGSALLQGIVFGILQQMGVDGFIIHAEKLMAYYKVKRDAMAISLSKWMTGLAEWQIPRAGMFFWIKLKKIEDSKKLILVHGLQKDIILVPGCYFQLDQSAPCSYLRGTFVHSSLEQIEEGIRRLSLLVKDNENKC